MEMLHSKVVGAGTPLLILHGYFGMGDNWKTHALALSKIGFEVHMIDQRNHGRSFHSDVFDYEVLVEDLLHYITAKGLSKCCVLGHSMGGKTAMLFATQYPELVEKLVVVDIGPKEYPPHHNEILAALNAVDFSVDSSRKLVDERLSVLIPEVGVRQFLMRSVYWREKGVLDFRFNVKGLTENNREVGRALPAFEVYEGGTLFVAGERSSYIQREDYPLIQAHFPAAIVKTVSKAGHWLHAENPQEFYEIVSEFLTESK